VSRRCVVSGLGVCLGSGWASSPPSFLGRRGRVASAGPTCSGPASPPPHVVFLRFVVSNLFSIGFLSASRWNAVFQRFSLLAFGFVPHCRSCAHAARFSRPPSLDWAPFFQLRLQAVHPMGPSLRSVFVCGYPTHVPHSYNAVMVILILWVNGLVVTCISRMAAFSPTGVARGFSLVTPWRTQWHSMMIYPFILSPTSFAYTFAYA
jgi:hypothetical protein